MPSGLFPTSDVRLWVERGHFRQLEALVRPEVLATPFQWANVAGMKKNVSAIIR
jgi:hypothetical protein